MSNSDRKTRDRIDGLIDAWSSEAPELPSHEFALIKRVARLHSLLESVLLDCLRDRRLSTAEYDILTTLRSTGSPYRLQPRTLAERTVLTSGGISNALRRLEARELVSRDADEHDARSSWVELTGAGIALALDASMDVITAQRSVLAPAEAHVPRASSALRDVLLSLGDHAH